MLLDLWNLHIHNEITQDRCFCPVWQHICPAKKIGQNSKNEVIAHQTEGPQAYAIWAAQPGRICQLSCHHSFKIF